MFIKKFDKGNETADRLLCLKHLWILGVKSVNITIVMCRCGYKGLSSPRAQLTLLSAHLLLSLNQPASAQRPQENKYNQSILDINFKLKHSFLIHRYCWLFLFSSLAEADTSAGHLIYCQVTAVDVQIKQINIPSLEDIVRVDIS